MFEAKYSKFLTVLLIIIIVAVIGLGVFLGYNYYKKYSTDKESEKFGKDVLSKKLHSPKFADIVFFNVYSELNSYLSFLKFSVLRK